MLAEFSSKKIEGVLRWQLIASTEECGLVADFFRKGGGDGGRLLLWPNVKLGRRNLCDVTVLTTHQSRKLE